MVLLLTLLGWFLFFRNSTTPSTTEAPVGGSPFGSAEGVSIPALDSQTTVGGTTSFDQNISAETKLFRISNTPVAGFTILKRNSEAVVRYVDRATGNIFETTLPQSASSTSLEKKRLTNNTLPKIYEAYFNSDGSKVLFRTLENDTDVVKNMTLTLTSPRSTSTSEFYGVSVTNLRGDLDSFLVSGNNLFYVSKDKSSIVSSDFSGDKLLTLFSASFNNWHLDKIGNSLLVSTKPSALSEGYVYRLPTTGGSLSKLLGPLNGLSAVANSTGSLLLYSYNENGVVKLFVKNIQKDTSSEILPATLADKCVWSVKESTSFYCGTSLKGISGIEPDNWYLGRTHFTDYIWRFNTTSEVAQLVSEPKTDFGLDLDVSKPTLSPNEDFLIFVNQRDLTLWAVKLN